MLGPAVSRALVRSRITPVAVSHGRRAFTHHTWISGPPRTRISFPEKMVHAFLLSVGVTFPGLWIRRVVWTWRHAASQTRRLADSQTRPTLMN
ncbi:hypothetical protein TCAL_15873 [Tigriopus californicus]|uniref:Uncharacterized protein n=1 Tax=Tigriopus californicus TaxID=6832 RepID=A0A553NP70_TIGCA|nr:hypothetical protein TCAL_15873 [Tigriopus californicus]